MINFLLKTCICRISKYDIQSIKIRFIHLKKKLIYFLLNINYNIYKKINLGLLEN